MRAAVFSDVHGNLIALEAVLAEAADADVDEYWVVGDLVAHGPHPAATLRRLMELPKARLVRGNTDRYVLTGDVSGMIPAIDTVRSAADVEVLVSASSAFAWTRGAITDSGGYDWLASLPMEHRTTLPDGTRVLLVHAAPGRDDGPGVQSAMTDRELLDDGLADAGAHLIFVGHTHLPLDRTVAGVRVVNVGSVSLPATADRRAMWTLLVADQNGFTIERRFADYDIEAVTSALDNEHHPSADWLRLKFHWSER
ncbi:MAG: metallophosphoesterase family protein [Propionibacteriales bacterium]|nr:metallophosphoesterase family protein [Propionibacteriales bacterium]